MVHLDTYTISDSPESPAMVSSEEGFSIGAVIGGVLCSVALVVMVVGAVAWKLKTNEESK